MENVCLLSDQPAKQLEGALAASHIDMVQVSECWNAALFHFRTHYVSQGVFDQALLEQLFATRSSSTSTSSWLDTGIQLWSAGDALCFWNATVQKLQSLTTLTQ